MEDPLLPLMATLFSYYDSPYISNDEILDYSIVCLQKCHDLIAIFSANGRYLEAFRQFQHCEEILKETKTDRKVITALPESHRDRAVFQQLEERTLLLHAKFETRRNTTSVATERVGPRASPQTGGGGVLMKKLHNHARMRTLPTTMEPPPQIMGNSSRRSSSSPLGIKGRDSSGGSRPHSPSQESTGRMSSTDGRKRTGTPLRHSVSPQEATETNVSIMKVDMRVLPEVERRCKQPSRPVSGSNWRSNCHNHLGRAAEVLKQARQTIVDMKQRAEELQLKRERVLDDVMMEMQQAANRVMEKRGKSPLANATVAQPPPKPAKEPVAPRRPSRSQTNAKDQQRQQAEDDLMQRLEQSVRRVSVAAATQQRSPSGSPQQRRGSQRRDSKGLGKATANFFLRRRQSSVREREKQLSGGERVPYKIHDPLHPLYNEYRRDQGLLSDEDEDDRGDESEENVDDANDDHLQEYLQDGAELESSFRRVADTSPKAVAEKLDQRIAKLRACKLNYPARVVSHELHQHIEDKLIAAAALGKDLQPLDAIRMTNDELERFLSAQTIEALKPKKHEKSFYFPSLFEETERFAVKQAVWGNLHQLQELANWTKVPPQELSTNLELCIATLRLQCWFRVLLAKREILRRQRNIDKHLIKFHRDTEAVAVLVRTFRHNMARKKVEAVRKRVAYVIEHRIELELNARPALSSAMLAGEGRTEFSTGEGSPAASRLGSRANRNKFDKSRHRGSSKSFGWGESMTGMMQSLSEFDQRAFTNPFPRMHPSRDQMSSIQRKIAARVICNAIRDYIAFSIEELQAAANQCMTHLKTGKYLTEDEVDLFDVDSTFGDPFSEGGGLLAKYSGDVLDRVERRCKGDVPLGEDEVGSMFVHIQHIKLSELEAQRVAAREADAAAKREHDDKIRKAAEQERIEAQHRTSMVLLIQRVGRGYRRRHWAATAFSSFQDTRKELRPIRAERFSLSLSNSTATLSKNRGESSPVEDSIDMEIMCMISKRNPDLLPDRRKEIEEKRLLAITLVQSELRSRASYAACLQRHKHRLAVRIQQEWRRAYGKMKESESVRVKARTSFVVESLLM